MCIGDEEDDIYPVRLWFLLVNIFSVGFGNLAFLGMETFDTIFTLQFEYVLIDCILLQAVLLRTHLTYETMCNMFAHIRPSVRTLR